MNEKLDEIFLGVYWSVRKQHVDDCAKQISDFLIKLREFDNEAFGQWFGKGWSKEEALEKKIDITNIEHIKQELLEKAQEGEEEFLDIGYHLSFWNGKDSLEGISISFHIGGYGGYSPNFAMIEFPFSGPIYHIYKDKKHLVNLAKFIFDFWNADSIRINDDKLTKEEFKKLA